jgi:hypothetical protein
MIVDHALSIVKSERKPMATYIGPITNEFFATRNCPDCHRRLVKRDAFVVVVCPCGWGWK